MSHKTIETIVFDVGDVLVHFRWREHMLNLGISPEDADFLGKRIIFSEYWHLMDEGSVDESTAPSYFSEQYPEYEKEIRRFFDTIENVVSEYPYSRGLIRGLKAQGYGIYLLSNYPKDIAKLHWSKFSFLNDLDGYIVSGEVKLTKPDPAIYRLLNEKFKVDLKKSLFIDDREDNVKGAVDLGMDGIVFKGYDALMGELMKRGISLI